MIVKGGVNVSAKFHDNPSGSLDILLKTTNVNLIELKKK